MHMTIVRQGSPQSHTEKRCNRMVTEVTRLAAAKDACNRTKVQTTRTGSHKVGCLSTASILHQQDVHDGVFHVKTNTKLSTALVFLLIFLTTLVSSLPTASVDILYDIDESELAHSRVILEEPPMVEFTKQAIEDSAKEFLGKFGYVKPAEWNDVSLRPFEDVDYLTDIAEGEQSEGRVDDSFGSGDENSNSSKGQGSLETWPTGIISEEQYHEALIKYQTLNGLNATGELDNDTTSYMGRPRCGVPDRIAAVKDHRTIEETTTPQVLLTSTSSIPDTGLTMETTFQTPLDELLRTYIPTTSTGEANTQELSLFGDEYRSGDNDSETHSTRFKRSYNAEKNIDVEYGNMQAVIDDIYGPITEGPLPNKSRIHDLKAMVEALRSEKLAKLKIPNPREAFKKMKSSVLSRPITPLPGLVYRIVMESRSSRQKRSTAYMQKAGWLRPFAHEVITWRLVQEWRTTRSFLTSSEIWYTIKLAFRMWSEIIPRKFREDRTSPISKVDILIGFGRNLHHRCRVPFRDGPIVKEYAHAWPLPRAEIHFNDDQPFVAISWDAAKDYVSFVREHRGRTPISLFKVAIHEIGHTLGLPHLNRRGSVMSPVYFPIPSKPIPEIGANDRNYIRRLYGHCNTAIDAVFDWVKPYTSDDGTRKLKYNTWFFRKSWFWKYDNGARRPSYGDPRYTKEEWRGVLDDHKYNPHKKIDGIVQIRDSYIASGPIYIFMGDNYVEYDVIRDHVKKHDSKGNTYPRKISDGFKGIPSPIDTVYYNMFQKRLYFFKDNWVYRYSWWHDQYIDKRHISSVFRGWGRASPLPGNIDAAYYSYTYTATFFFKGPYFWKLADERDRIKNKGMEILDDSVGPMKAISTQWHYICDVDETEMSPYA